MELGIFNWPLLLLFQKHIGLFHFDCLNGF